jgi:uncharacterized protein (DUF1330 family)
MAVLGGRQKAYHLTKINALTRFLCIRLFNFSPTARNAMKTQYMIALGMLAGVGLGAAAVQGLHAQAKPPAYLVIEISKINDAEGFKTITQRPTGGADAAKDFGGHYVVRTDKITPLDGTAPQRLIVYAFESVEKAKGFNSSPYMKEVNAIRNKTTEARSFIVEGM